MMSWRRIVLVTLVCLLVAAGLLVALRAGGATAAPAARKKVTLLVHAGAGLRPALDELGRVYQEKTGTQIAYNYKGSACLLPDVLMSGKGDVYIPGEDYYARQAADRKLVKAGYPTVATMSTVIIVQPGNPKHIRGLADLAKPGIRLGLGDPKAVACGRAAKQSLEKAKLWEGARKNMVMSALNVTELSNGLKLKHLDAAIVWNATAAIYGSTDLQQIALPAQETTTSMVPAAVVAASRRSREAQRYVDFLASPEATRIFVKHGYGAPPAPAALRVATGSAPRLRTVGAGKMGQR
jgi:molybdate transport system substrate-binding protein